MVTQYATTVATDRRGATRVTHHNTVVVRWDDDTIELDSGGWKSATTKQRMNQASQEYELGVRVYQKQHEWYVDYNGKTSLYTDGMLIKRQRR